MGTTLTGTTPQDTYDSLIKVTDNGPLSGTLKALSDGLGNDSTLSLSTTAASIAGTLAVSGNVTIDTSTLVVDAANNRVGINTAAPDTTLVVGGILTISGGAAAGASSLFTTSLTGVDRRNWLIKTEENVEGDFVVKCSTAAGGSALTGDTRLCILKNGNVGIGTTAPTTLGAGITSLDVAGTAGGGFTTRGATVTAELLALDAAGGFYVSTKTNHPIILRTNDVERVRITNNGLTFNGDTAAANALDDYEEGTFTPSVAFGGASVGITYFDRQGNYTKIGRQVTCTMYIAMTAVGTSTGSATIEGLPFAASNANRGTVSAVSLRFDNITFAGQLMANTVQGGTSITLSSTSLLGVDTAINETNFNSSSEFNAITVTYFTA